MDGNGKVTLVHKFKSGGEKTPKNKLVHNAYKNLNSLQLLTL